MFLRSISAAFFLLFFYSFILSAAEPAVPLRPLPPDDQLELYEESEELFQMKVMEFYEAALTYKIQMSLLGHTSNINVFPPTLDELTDLDVEVIKQYYSLARSLYSEILQVPDNEIVSLKSNIAILKKQIVQMKGQMVDTVWATTNTCAEDKIKLGHFYDSLYNARINQLVEFYEKDQSNLITVFSMSIAANIFASGDDAPIESKPALSLRVNLNIYKLFGFGKTVDIWYEYAAPKIQTNALVEAMPSYTVSEYWNSHLHSVGISARTRQVFSDNSFVDGLKLGIGSLWANGSVYNKDVANFSWSAIRADIEYFAGNFGKKMPIELFIFATIYQSVGDELIFYHGNPGAEPIYLGKTQYGFGIGVRYNFWRVPF
jgi:hypothetical protein